MTATRDARGGISPAPGHDGLTRRSFLGSLAAISAVPALASAPTAAHAPASRTGRAPRQEAGGAEAPIPVQSWNHMTLTVTDIGRSREFYQGLFGMTVAARQARTLILRVGDGPQFIALGGGRPNVTPHINHFCLTVDAFDDERLRRHPGRARRRADRRSGTERSTARSRPDARGPVRRGARGNAGALPGRSGRRGRPAPGHDLLRRRRAAGRALPVTRAGGGRGRHCGSRHQPLHGLRVGPGALDRVLPGPVRDAQHAFAGRAAAALGRLGSAVPRACAGARPGPHPRTPASRWRTSSTRR